ncbi:hypothetical protein EP7_000815 [Isosphaeraceae bacterium EP7]
MDATERSTWFIGDLGDPWVRDLAEALPSAAARWHCAGDLPQTWPQACKSARLIVIHRSTLTESDLRRIVVLRGPGSPRVILVAGAYAESVELARWSRHVDLILTDATAASTLARQLSNPAPATSIAPARQLAVVSTDFEVRRILVELVEAAGALAIACRDWLEVPPGLPALWDVPTLEPGWSDDLARQSAGRRVICLLAFADRTTVREARRRGASACLDWPCDPLDLAWVLTQDLERPAVPRSSASTSPGRGDGPEAAVPPAPASARRSQPSRALAVGDASA